MQDAGRPDAWQQRRQRTGGRAAAEAADAVAHCSQTRHSHRAVKCCTPSLGTCVSTKTSKAHAAILAPHLVHVVKVCLCTVHLRVI